MHTFLRAIGFSEYKDRKQIQKLVRDIVISADEREYASLGDHSLFSAFSKYFGPDIGICVCGEFDEEDNYNFEYYYPFLRSDVSSSTDDIAIERRTFNEAYSGVCDDPRVGVSLIFYLRNIISYMKLKNAGKLPVRGTSLNLSALASQGTVMLPILKTERQLKKIQQDSVNRNRLIQAARGGDEEAIESLTLEDMDTYSSISRKIRKQDIFSMVDSYFMPYGAECDLYSVLGEIEDVKTVTNELTGEKIYIMGVTTNDLYIRIAINTKDLMGEPEAGRRFKGQIWLLGQVNFPE